jgi:hypothetical protein
MRFLKRQTINRRQLKDTTVYSDVSAANVYINPRNSGSMVLPSGTDAQIPSSPVNGMMRYNVDHNEVQVYQSGTWRSLRFKEPALITQQNLGAGNGEEVYFGPISPSPGAYASTASGMTWNVVQMAKNMLVVVENVFQLSGTNYTVVQNPTIGAEAYSPATSVSAASGATTLYFNSALVATGASGATGTVTLTFSTRPAAPFSVGSSIIVTGFKDNSVTGLEYNGTYTVTACNTTSVSYTNATTATMTVAGQVASADAIYPSANFTSAIITGSGSLQASTAITTFAIDADTDALVSATFTSKPLTNTIAANVTLDITEASPPTVGYYLKFSSPVPNGKVVTALIGFDQ